MAAKATSARPRVRRRTRRWCRRELAAAGPSILPRSDGRAGGADTRAAVCVMSCDEPAVGRSDEWPVVGLWAGIGSGTDDALEHGDDQRGERGQAVADRGCLEASLAFSCSPGSPPPITRRTPPMDRNTVASQARMPITQLRMLVRT